MIDKTKELAAANGWWMSRQFENEANPEFHSKTTAQEIVRVLQPDIVLTDIMMPEVNGWEVLRALKEDEETAQIPVIIISILDQRKLGSELGAADYLVKPVDRETLRAQVQRALGN